MLPIDVAKLKTLLSTEFTNGTAKANAYNTSAMHGLIKTATGNPEPTAATIISGIKALPAGEQATYARLIKFLREFCPGVDEKVVGNVTYRGFGFRKNGPALLARAQEAWALMGRLATKCRDHINLVRDPTLVAASRSAGAVSSDEATAVALYEKWFDKKRKHSRIATVKSVVTRLHKAVTAEPFEIICEGDPDDPNGLCYPNPIAPREFGEVRSNDGRNRFYLGPVFFDELQQQMGSSCSLSVQPRTGQTYTQAKSSIMSALNASTITMYHEITHITAIGGTKDKQPGAYDPPKCQERANNDPDVACDNAENYALFAKDVLLKLQFSPPPMKR